MLLGGRVVVPGGSVAGQGSGWSIVAPDQQGARLSYGFAHGLVLLPPYLTVAAAHAWFDTLAEECAQAIASGLVLVAGDINARTAGRSESTDDAAQPRESFDTVINSHGRALLHFCCTTGLRMYFYPFVDTLYWYVSVRAKRSIACGASLLLLARSSCSAGGLSRTKCRTAAMYSRPLYLTLM